MWYFLLTSSYVSIFFWKLSFYFFFVKSQTLALFFLCFSAFCKCLCLLCKNTFVSTFILGKFCFTLTWRGLKTIKLKKNMFFLSNSNKFTMTNNPHMQLPAIFHKTVNKNKQKTWKFRSSGKVGNFFLYLPLFLFLHINFQK